MAVLPFLCCLFVTIFIFVSPASAQPISERYFCDKDNDRGNYTANSTYHTNLNALLSTLTSNTETNYGFYNLSYGQNTDKVYAIGLCRGDIKTDTCRSCLNNGRINLTQHCPNRKEAIGWYNDETCMLRYSDRSIFGLMEIGPAYYAWSMNNASNAVEFNRDVKNLLDSLASKASSGDSRRKYATASAIGPNNQTIYGLAQCTPDLSASDCFSCLQPSITVIPSCCNNRIGARIVRPSCTMRYETNFVFYSTTTDAPPPPPPPPPAPSTNNTSSEGNSNTSRIAIAVAVPVVVVVVVLSFIFIYLRVRKPRKGFISKSKY